MNEIFSSRSKVYCLDDRELRRQPRNIAERPSVSTRSWLVTCAAIGIACGILGWSLGGSSGEPAAAKETASVAARAGHIGRTSRDVMSPPFGEPAASRAEAARAPTVPFVLMSARMEQGRPTAILEREGYQFVAQGLSVHGDYLIQVDRERIVFTYLPSAVRHSIALPPVAPTASALQRGAPAAYGATATRRREPVAGASSHGEEEDQDGTEQQWRR